MKRKDILDRLGFTVPELKKKRVIIHSDIKCEADDPFAIMHHLLTPSIDVKGIIAGHFESSARMIEAYTQTHELTQEQIAAGSDFVLPRGKSMEASYQEGKKILELAGIDDVPLLRGSALEISDVNQLPASEGADFMIKEALRDDDKPLYIALMGCLTDLAIAYLKEPAIADRLTAIWIGGGEYPSGEDEFNIKQDLEAARIVFASPIKIWQIPKKTYRTMEVSLAELVRHVRPCGAIGRYLCEQMLAFNDKMGRTPLTAHNSFPHGESWVVGDNPTLTVLMQNSEWVTWHTEKAPFINDDATYAPNPDGKLIRVYDMINTRMSFGDLFAKLDLCYRGENR